MRPTTIKALGLTVHQLRYFIIGFVEEGYRFRFRKLAIISFVLIALLFSILDSGSDSRSSPLGIYFSLGMTLAVVLLEDKILLFEDHSNGNWLLLGRIAVGIPPIAIATWFGMKVSSSRGYYDQRLLNLYMCMHGFILTCWLFLVIYVFDWLGIGKLNRTTTLKNAWHKYKHM